MKRCSSFSLCWKWSCSVALTLITLVCLHLPNTLVLGAPFFTYLGDDISTNTSPGYIVPVSGQVVMTFPKVVYFLGGETADGVKDAGVYMHEYNGSSWVTVDNQIFDRTFIAQPPGAILDAGPISNQRALRSPNILDKFFFLFGKL